MRRVEARVVSTLLLLVLGIALASVALGPDFDPPGHYDGDGDDVGLIWKTLSQWADIPAIGGQLRFIASVPLGCVAPDDSSGFRPVARDPVGSRAPPALLLARSSGAHAPRSPA